MVPFQATFLHFQGVTCQSYDPPVSTFSPLVWKTVGSFDQLWENLWKSMARGPDENPPLFQILTIHKEGFRGFPVGLEGIHLDVAQLFRDRHWNWNAAAPMHPATKGWGFHNVQWEGVEPNSLNQYELIWKKEELEMVQMVQLKTFTPWKINSWNLQITHEKKGKWSEPNLHDYVPCESSGVYCIHILSNITWKSK